MASKYNKIIEHIFHERYEPGSEKISFTRDQLIECAEYLQIKTPKNIGDIIYSFRYRTPLPKSIQITAPKGKEWIIVGEGSANYCFQLSVKTVIEPNPYLENIPIPNNTPESIVMYQLSDEQSLLCKLRYNRILDIFLGLVTYSMQNHLRTTVNGIGQIEIDEIYVGINKIGQQFIIPVEAKIGKDKIGVVQTMQDIQYCKQKFPELICIPIAVHTLEGKNTLCIFRLTLENDEVKIVDEKHYRLVYSDKIDRHDIAERNRDLTGV